MNTPTYEILCKLNLTSGETIDISTSIRELIIKQSILSKVILYDLVVSNTVLRYINSDLSHVSIDIIYKLQGNDLLYSFEAIPIKTGVGLYAETFEQKVTPTRDFDHIRLIDRNLYDIVYYPIKSQIVEGYTLSDIIDKLKPTKLNEIIYDPTFNKNPILQVLIPSGTLDSVLQYLQFWFGFYEGAAITAYRFDPSAHKTSLIFEDISWRFKSAKFDFTIIKFDEGSSIDRFQEDAKVDNQLTTMYPIHIKNHLPKKVTFNKLDFIEKPLHTLHRRHSWSIEEFLSKYTACDADKIDLKENNTSRVLDNNLLVNNHTGFSHIPFTSLIAQDFLFSSTLTITEDNRKPFILWPGSIVKLQIDNLDLMKFQGLYVTDVVSYHFKLENPYWTLVSTFSLGRTNYVSR